MFKRFIKWIFGIQDKEEQNDNTNDVQNEQSKKNISSAERGSGAE